MDPDDPRSRCRLRVAIARPDGLRVRAAGLARWLEAVAPATAHGEVVVALVSDGRMRALNRTYRGADRATDVLAFPSQPPGRERRAAREGRRGPAIPLGDIVIAAGVAARQAAEAGHGLQTELRILALHGLLHLLGYDHARDGGRMARVEARLRRRGGLPHGVIERARGRRTGRTR